MMPPWTKNETSGSASRRPRFTPRPRRCQAAPPGSNWGLFWQDINMRYSLDNGGVDILYVDGSDRESRKYGPKGCEGRVWSMKKRQPILLMALLVLALACFVATSEAIEIRVVSPDGK